MNKTWLVRNHKDGDEDEIFELTKAVWGTGVPEKEQWIKGWKWMHIDNPAGTSMMWLAEDGGKIVSQYPVIFENMKIGNKILKGAQLVDTMTHPQYRRQGICSTLGKNTLNEIENGKNHLVYCFPTPQVYPLHIKSGWIDVCAFQVMFKPLNLNNMLEKYFTRKKLPLIILTISGKLITKIVFRAKKPPKINGLTISKVSYFDDRFDDFWQEVSNNYNIVVIRDKEYLNWRYVDVPNKEYIIYVAQKHEKVYGYIVLGYTKVKGLIYGHIYDLIASSDREDILRCLISKAVEHLEEEKADAILSHMVPNTIYRKVLLRSGFIPYPRNSSRFLAYDTSSDLSHVFLKNSKNWFIQLGDLPTIY